MGGKGEVRGGGRGWRRKWGGRGEEGGKGERGEGRQRGREGMRKRGRTALLESWIRPCIDRVFIFKLDSRHE